MINELCNYINCLFKNITNYQDVIIGTNKIEEFLLKNNIKLDTSLAVKLFRENDCLLEAFDLLYYSFEDSIKENKLDNISSCYTLLFLLRTYCILNEIIVDIDNINEIHILSHEEEIILIKRIKKGDKVALEYFIQCNMPLVKRVAKMFNTFRMTYEDLIQEGCLGLMRAINLYDEDLGNKFSSYATAWIYQSISRAIDNKERMITLPVYLVEKMKKYINTKDYLFWKLKREPSDEEVAEAMNIDVNELKKFKSYFNDALSLDKLLNEDADITFGDVIEDDEYDLEEIIVKEDLKEALKRFIESCHFDEIELKILQLRYGFNSDRCYTRAEVAKLLNVNRESIRQREIKILKKMLKNQDVDNFIIYMQDPKTALENLLYLRDNYVNSTNYTRNLERALKKKNIQ